MTEDQQGKEMRFINNQIWMNLTPLIKLALEEVSQSHFSGPFPQYSRLSVQED